MTVIANACCCCCKGWCHRDSHLVCTVQSCMQGGNTNTSTSILHRLLSDPALTLVVIQTPWSSCSLRCAAIVVAVVAVADAVAIARERDLRMAPVEPRNFASARVLHSCRHLLHVLYFSRVMVSQILHCTVSYSTYPQAKESDHGLVLRRLSPRLTYSSPRRWSRAQPSKPRHEDR